MTTVKATVHHRPSTHVITAEVEAATPATSSDVRLQRNGYLVRRFSVVFFDLGLREILPANWVVPTADGVDFGLLSFKDADRLALTLEDLIRGGRPELPAPGPDQLSFFPSGA